MADKADIKNTKTCPPKRTIEQTNKKTYISLIYVFVYLYLLGIHPSFHTLSRLLLFAVPRFLGCSDTPTLKTLGDSRESGARSPAAWLQGFDTPLPTCRTPTTNSSVLCQLCTKRKKATRSQGRPPPRRQRMLGKPRPSAPATMPHRQQEWASTPAAESPSKGNAHLGQPSARRTASARNARQTAPAGARTAARQTTPHCM